MPMAFQPKKNEELFVCDLLMRWPIIEPHILTHTPHACGASAAPFRFALAPAS